MLSLVGALVSTLERVPPVVVAACSLASVVVRRRATLDRADNARRRLASWLCAPDACGPHADSCSAWHARWSARTRYWPTSWIASSSSCGLPSLGASILCRRRADRLSDERYTDKLEKERALSSQLPAPVAAHQITVTIEPPTPRQPAQYTLLPSLCAETKTRPSFDAPASETRIFLD